MTYQRLLSLLFLSGSVFSNLAHAQLSPNVTVWATGLNAPRGIKFDANGYLYVSEAGLGGSVSTVGECQQVVPPIGPYLGGQTGRISKIDGGGNVSTVATGFASSLDSVGDLMGVADIAFLDGSLYALVAGGGCSHGNPRLPSGIYKVNLRTGTGALFANLDAFLKLHPAAYEQPADFEPDGSFYSMIVNDEKLYVVEPNHGQIFSIDSQGKMQEVLDVSVSQGHIVPTSLLAYEDNLYLGNLGLFPINPTSSRLMTISPSNCLFGSIAGLQNTNAGLDIVHSRAGFTTMVGVSLGPDGLIYVLELSNGVGNPTPGLGDVVRISAAGEIESVATGLTLQTAMTFGPDGKLYVSNFGAYNLAGSGQILQIEVN